MSPLVRLCRPLLARVLVVAALCFAVNAAYCQKQEQVISQRLDTRNFQSRIDDPDLSMTSSFAGKEFSPRGKTDTQKSATVRAFPFAKSSAYTKDFRSKDFLGAKSFKSKDYAGLKDASVKSYAQTDKTFGTKSFDVRDDRQANKTFATRDFLPGQREGVIQKGKSQDTFDEIMHRKDLNIDQVRELLNKNK